MTAPATRGRRAPGRGLKSPLAVPGATDVRAAPRGPHGEDPGYEYVDSEDHTYDPMGNPNTSKFWESQRRNRTAGLRPPRIFCFSAAVRGRLRRRGAASAAQR